MIGKYLKIEIKRTSDFEVKKTNFNSSEKISRSKYAKRKIIVLFQLKTRI